MVDSKSKVLVIYSGKVQGVGFRYSVCDIIDGFNLSGYVKNLSNGDVELCVEGENEQLMAFLEKIESSHLKNYIIEAKKQWSKYNNEFTGFNIRR